MIRFSLHFGNTATFVPEYNNCVTTVKQRFPEAEIVDVSRYPQIILNVIVREQTPDFEQFIRDNFGRFILSHFNDFINRPE